MILTLSIIALVLSLVGNVLVNYKKKLGFIIWISSNVFWIVVNFLGDVNYPQVIMYIVYAALNVQGYVNWRKSENKVRVEAIEEMDDIFKYYNTEFQNKCNELISEISDKFKELGFADIYLTYYKDEDKVSYSKVEEYIHNKLFDMDEYQRHDMNEMSKMLSTSNCAWHDYEIGEIIHRELLKIWNI